jgi:hypothetical protein
VRRGSAGLSIHALVFDDHTAIRRRRGELPARRDAALRAIAPKAARRGLARAHAPLGYERGCRPPRAAA